MQYGGYGKKYRVKPRFYVIVVLLLGLSAWGLVEFLGLFRPATIEWGRLSSNQAISAIVLRDETVVKAEEVAKLACIATEGEAVEAGAPVAMQYLSGFSEKDISSLIKWQNDIKDYQENNILRDFINNDLNTLNEKIDKKMKEISEKALSQQTHEMALAEHELRSLMAERKAFMPTIVNADETLNRMYQQEATLEEKINKTRKTVNAPVQGYVSFYLDGYEGELNVDSIEKMTPVTMKELMNAVLKSSKTFMSSEQVLKDQPICRIVNPAKWYAVIVINARENPLLEGTEREVTFDGLPETVNAKVIKVASEGRNSIAVLEVPEGVREMLSLRLVNGHLGQDIEGYRVPLNMVLEDNGRAYIALQGSGGSAKRVEIHLLGRDEKYAIIKEATGEGVLDIGLPLSKP